MNAVYLAGRPNHIGPVLMIREIDVKNFCAIGWRPACVAATLLCAAALAHAQTAPVISCSGDNAAVLNTGASATGGIDNHWRYQGLPAYAGADPNNWAPVFGDAWLGKYSSSWASEPGTGDWRWIAANAGGVQPTIAGNTNPWGNVDALFRIDFALDPSIQPAAFAPTMTFRADNSVVDIMVNGKWQGPLSPTPQWTGLPQAGVSNQFNYTGFSSGGDVTFNMASTDWQAGTNTMVVYVKSSPWGMGFSGFLTSNNVCPNGQPPTATPTLTGGLSVGSLVSGSYLYQDADGDLEDASASGSTFRLLRSSDAALTPSSPTAVLASGPAGGAGVSHALYTLQQADLGAYLYYCVTPAAKTGLSPGPESCTMAIGPIAAVPPAAVPTLSEWALMLLSLFVGALMLKRGNT